MLASLLFYFLLMAFQGERGRGARASDVFESRKFNHARAREEEKVEWVVDCAQIPALSLPLWIVGACEARFDDAVLSLPWLFYDAMVLRRVRSSPTAPASPSHPPQ
jgi:hypothetical protein